MVKLDKLELDIAEPGRTSRYTHNFHPYAAKFIPQIPAYFVENYSAAGDIVLDPFCGSGTTLVEARINGRNTIGYDINPLSVLMTRVKATPLSKNESDKVSEISKLVGEETWSMQINLVKHGEDWLQECGVEIPSFDNIDHWFSKKMKMEIAWLLHMIERNKHPESVLDFCKLALASIIVKVSNQDSETRYRAVSKEREIGYATSALIKKIQDMGQRMEDFAGLCDRSDCTTRAIHGDSRKLEGLEENSIDLIVTSPPYPNTYDYYLYHKQRMFWLGLDWVIAKKNEIGSRLRHSSYGEGIENYLSDMKMCFQRFNDVLKDKSHLAIVVGDAYIQGTKYDGAWMIEQAMEGTSFNVEERIQYNLGKASRLFNKKFRKKDKNEYILVLKKSKQQGL